MAKIKDEVEMHVHKISAKVWDISTIFGGYFRHRVYMGYTEKQAVEQFKEDLINEVI